MSDGTEEQANRELNGCGSRGTTTILNLGSASNSKVCLTFNAIRDGGYSLCPTSSHDGDCSEREPVPQPINVDFLLTPLLLNGY